MSQKIERVKDISESSFFNDFWEPRRPVIISDIIGQWPAFSKWSFKYLKAKIGNREVFVSVSKTGIFRLNPVTGIPLERRSIPFDQCLDLVENTAPNAAERIYMGQASFQEILPELLPDFSVPAVVKSDEYKSINFWLGPRGNVSPLHYDPLDNFLAQVMGTKRCVLFDPSQSDYLYPYDGKTYFFGQVDIDNPDLEKFPLQRHAKSIECTIGAGEMLFIPALWWHQVYTLETSISINFWWRSHIRHMMNATGTHHLAHIAREVPLIIHSGRINTSGFSNLLDVAVLATHEGQLRIAVLFAGAAIRSSMAKACKQLEIPLEHAHGAKPSLMLYENLCEKAPQWREYSTLVPKWIAMQVQSATKADIKYTLDEVSAIIAGIRVINKAIFL